MIRTNMGLPKKKKKKKKVKKRMNEYAKSILDQTAGEIFGGNATYNTERRFLRKIGPISERRQASPPRHVAVLEQTKKMSPTN